MGEKKKGAVQVSLLYSSSVVKVFGEGLLHGYGDLASVIGILLEGYLHGACSLESIGCPSVEADIDEVLLIAISILHLWDLDLKVVI